MKKSAYVVCLGVLAAHAVMAETFVRLGDDLATAITAATAGEELHLQAGTFAVGATISSSKSLTISGGWNADGSAQVEGAVTTLDGGGDGSTSGTADGLLRFTAGSGTVTLSRLVFARGWASGLVKSGNASLVVTDCQFLDNGYYPTVSSEKGYQGLGAKVSGSTSSTEVRFTRCTFSNNVTRCLLTSSNGKPYLNLQGAGLHAQNLKALTLDQADFLFNGVPHSRGHKASDMPGRDGMHGAAVYASAAPTTATGCRFVGNHGTSHNTTASGSIVYLTGSAGGSSFKNCLWAGNLTSCYSGGNWPNSAGSLVVDLGASSAAVSVENCTIAFNAIEGSNSSSAGLNVVKGAVTLRSSIIWGNLGTYESSAKCKQCVSVQANGSLDADYSLFDGEGSDFIGGAVAPTLGPSMKYGDPLFATPSNFLTENLAFGWGTSRFFYFKDTMDFSALDVHLRSPLGRWTPTGYVTSDTELSPAVDFGDEKADFSNEPEPNGGRVNMGFYGNTDQASKSETVVAKIGGCTIAETTNYTDPTATITLGSDGDWEFPVQFCWGMSRSASEGAEGWEHVLVVTSTGKPGDVLTRDFGKYLESGATVYYRVVLGGNKDTLDGEYTVSGETPPFWGKGGGANIIHVFGGAPSLGAGTNWSDAFGTLEDALKAVTPERNTIWISGTLVRTAQTPAANVTTPVTIIGGFQLGDEEEPDAGSAVLDGAMSYNGLVLNNTAAVTIRNVDFVRAKEHGLAKTGAGDLTLAKCRFLDNGYGREVDGRGLLCSGAAAATVTMTDCVVSGNVSRVSEGMAEQYGGDGDGASFSMFRAVVLTHVDFLDNGFSRQFLTRNQNNHNGGTPGRTASRGSALRIVDAPMTATGCRFVGNRGTCLGDYGGCTVSVEGASGGSTFANCLFSANASYWYEYDASAEGKVFGWHGGALNVRLGDAALAVSLVNCTFAHNLIFARDCAAALTVDKGAVSVRNSIFWGNRFGAASCGNLHDEGNFLSAHEIYVKSTGSVAFDYSLIASVEAPSVRVDEGGLWVPTNVLNDDPLFVTTTNEVLAAQARRTNDAWRYADYFPPDTNLEAFNVHLRSRTGYVDETTGELVKHSGVRSPAIDAGDPTTPVGDEPSPNGHRVNLGYYGGTQYASGSSMGLVLLFK